MMLFVDGLNQGVSYYDVNYYIRDYESAFDLLNQLVTNGWTLTSVTLIDNGDCMSLPIEAFDGEPFNAQIHDLKKAWKSVLKQPLNPKVVSRQILVNLEKPLLEPIDTRITFLNFTIDTYEQQLEKMQYIFYQEPYRTLLIERLKRTISLLRKQVHIAMHRKEKLHNILFDVSTKVKSEVV